MPKPRPDTRPPVPLSDEALDWVIRLHSGSETEADHRAWEGWRQQSPAHAAAAREAELIWNGLDLAVPAWDRQVSKRRMTRRAVLGGGLAVVAGGGLYQSGVIGPQLWADHSTRMAERRDLRLPDGTRVTLNARSALSKGVARAPRGAVLHQGQARFRVEPAAAGPFAVGFGRHRLHSAAGEFDVDWRPGGVAVTLFSGRAEVAPDGRAPVLLAPDQRLILTGSGPLGPEPIDATAESAWLRGKLIFNQRSLGDLLAEVERYSPGRIVVLGDQLATMRVTGVFELSDPGAILDSLEQSLPVRISRLPLLTVIRSA